MDAQLHPTNGDLACGKQFPAADRFTVIRYGATMRILVSGQKPFLSRTLAIIALIGSAASNSHAADLQLQPDTLAAWNDYIYGAKSRMKERAKPGAYFLWMDEDATRAAKVKKGEIVAAPVDKENNPLQVPSGLIHHWIGAGFVPNSTLKDVFAVVNDYQRYKDIYQPSVIESKLISRNETEGRFNLLLQSKSHFVKTAFDGEYSSQDVQLDPKRWYGFSTTTNIQEIQHYRQANQTKLPPGQGSGIIWRLFSVNRFEERDGGVYVELEALLLSREIPNGLHWLVDPIVRRVAKSSLVTSLQQTGSAVTTLVALNKSKSEPATQRATANPAPTNPTETEIKSARRTGVKGGQN
jgi:hypothetical protein